MLDDNPVLKERLMACGAFGGIALFAVVSVNLLITGGFDFEVGQRDVARPQQPSAYVRVVDAANYVSDRFRSISWDEPLFIDSAEAATSEDLAGANDGSSPPAEAVSGDDLYQQIASLYESDASQVEEPTYVNADQAYEEPEPVELDQTDAAADKIASAYETESPW